MLTTRIRCFYKNVEDDEVVVECKYFRLPWERNVVSYVGTFLGGDAVELNGYLKLTSILGKVQLSGKSGERGLFHYHAFTYQHLDVNAIGLKNNIAIIHLIGKGKYFGKIYGTYVSGTSSGDEVFGVPPLRGRKAFLEVDGLIINKLLPSPDDLNEYDLSLPYVVLNVGENCKELYVFKEMEYVTSDGEIIKLQKGLNKVCRDGLLYYKGFVEEPNRVIFLPKGYVIGSVVRKFEYKENYVYITTPRKTYVIDESVRKELPPVEVYCSKDEDHEAYYYNGTLEISLKGIRLKSNIGPISSCEFLDEDLIVTIPSAQVTQTLRIIEDEGFIVAPFPRLSYISPHEWEELWGRSNFTQILSLQSRKSLTLESGILKLLPFPKRDKLLVYNLYGNVYIMNKDLEIIWQREANAVRSAATSERGFVIWTQRPPRIRVFKISNDKIKEISKFSFGLNHVALCYNKREKLYEAIDDKGRYIAINEDGEVVFKSNLRPAWSCLGIGRIMLTITRDGIERWERLTAVQNWNEFDEIAILQGELF